MNTAMRSSAQKRAGVRPRLGEMSRTRHSSLRVWPAQRGMTLVKIHRLGAFEGPKYVEAIRNRPGIYPDPSIITPGRALIVTEGEFDTLPLGQALGDLAAVVTLGAASSKPRDRSIYRHT